MAQTIKDGTGSSRVAKVDSTNRLFTRTVAQTLQNEAALNADAYFIGSGLVTLTSTSPSAVFYIKNNEDRDLLVISLTFQTKESAGATSGLYDVAFYKDPTSISSATDGAQLNTNFGSSDALSATIQKGAEGSSITGGTPVAAFMLRHGQLEEVLSSVVLPKNSSFAVLVTPSPGNTSMPISFSSRCFLVSDDIA